MPADGFAIALPRRRMAGTLRLAAGQFARNRVAMAGLVVLLLICLAVLFAPTIAPYDPIRISLSTKLRPPSFQHPLGTDYSAATVYPACSMAAGCR